MRMSQPKKKKSKTSGGAVKSTVIPREIRAEYLNLRQVLAAMPEPVSQKTLFRRVYAGTFPRPHRLTHRLSPPLWDRESLKEWARDKYFLMSPELYYAFCRTIKVDFK